LDFFRKNILKYYRSYPKPIALCSDHSGHELKKMCIEILKDFQIDYIDYGVYIKKDCDYIDFLKPAIYSVNNGTCDFVIASCRTANGMVIAANKFPDI
jgi:RpiB/LacA/LacB family sugar-phosphate isomerase